MLTHNIKLLFIWKIRGLEPHFVYLSMVQHLLKESCARMSALVEGSRLFVPFFMCYSVFSPKAQWPIQNFLEIGLFTVLKLYMYISVEKLSLQSTKLFLFLNKVKIFLWQKPKNVDKYKSKWCTFLYFSDKNGNCPVTPSSWNYHS